ncbi:hypothetical protein F0562_017742 [Nyssa sinensis]|uniref:Uncharacterized protein n=1 Tax=Nyssa sinensis TaxID=561372 RepID=A0A5J4ZHA6_9ASTE|nr:hypothetical protein F0562_017742 [Nyssa sinensis]
MRILFISWLFLTLFFQILFGSNTVLISGQCLDDQQSLLLQLKKSLNFSSSSSTKLVLWNQSSDCCLWDGVTCNTAGRVIGLDLNNESISGGFDDSSSLFSLQFLQSLNLAFNRFSFTQIPNGFGNLTSLTYLNLSNAGFAGQIPTEFSSMTRLVTLDLSTLFPGIHPLKLENPNLTMFVQNLSELKELRLDGVNISARGSDWCNAISSRLPYLLVLSLLNCDLSGPIDPSLLELRSLSVIRLAQNDFSSPVPEFFANFRNLTQLDLSSCNLNGTFPRRIIQVTTLQTLDLANNELLEGSLPEFSPYASLQNLVLSMTKFSGTLPDSIGNLEMLSRIELVRCNFSGRIPNSMAGLTQLVYLDFSSNNFTGSIPSFSLSKNLTNIDLSRNDLTGEIPSSHWEGLQSLVNLNLGYNSLNGSIPVSLFSLPSLQKIQLSNNKFAGQFNDILNVSSHKLDTLDLSSNNLTGPIPKFVFQLQGLKILSLSSNDFDGSIKLSMIENFKNLTTLDLSYNNLSVDATMSNFSGSSFPQISTLKLASCNLNVFPNLKNQSKLSYLDLSKNQIHGKIPNWVWNIGNGLPGYLNLSYNMLVEFEGPFPLVAANLSILDLHSNFLQGRNCFDEYIDKFVLMILQTLGFIYISCDDVKVEVEETIEEPRDDSEDADDDEDEDEMEDKTFHGRYCVFCSKLDISRKKAIHNPKCDCHDSPPTSFSKLDISRKKAIHNPKCDCHDSPPTSFSSSSSSSSL